MSVNILIPYNFSPNDEKAVDFVGQRYAERHGVAVTLFHAYTPVPEVDIRDTQIMKQVVHNVSVLKLKQDERQRALEEVRHQLMRHGIAADNIQCVFTPVKTDIATDIINLWKEGRFDVVVLNRNPGNIVNFFSRSISKRIVRHVNGGIGVHIVN
ncbi:MAG: universal stress protein [Desulfobacterales bacterium]|nr:universal stress protein [Desulfobacterales bacterium]